MSNRNSNANMHDHDANRTEIPSILDSAHEAAAPDAGKDTESPSHTLSMPGNGPDSLLEGCLDTDPGRWPVQLWLLGNFRLLRKGEPVSLHRRGKAIALLSYLGLHYGRRVTGEQLQTHLWPDSESIQARRSLNNLTYSLNKRLRDALGGSNLVLYKAGFYRLNLEAGLIMDIACFDELFRKGNQAAQTEDVKMAAEYFRQAAILYRGELCIDSDIQTILERERLRNNYSLLLAHLAAFYYRSGDEASCLEYAWKLLDLDPCREDAHRLIMRAYTRSGQRAMALRHYQVCVDILKAEFNAPPEMATTALFDRIRLQPDFLDSNLIES